MRAKLMNLINSLQVARSMNNNTPVLIIAGPTASGKSRLAIDVAQQLNGVILNCDAMQIYKDIPIIAATPSAEEKQKAEHRLFELYECSKRGNVVEWLDLCVAEIKRCWQEKRLPIVVGGTGMYIDALINGVTPIPEVPQEIRQQIQQKSLAERYAFLLQHDSLMAQKLHPNDSTRITRAMEIITFTGQTLTEWYQKPLIKKLPEANFTVVKIVPPLDIIEERCKQRLDIMVYQQNALKEIQKLATMNLASDLPAMKALGVPEMMQYVQGKTTLQEAVDLAKLHTRQYAKRQRTWLKNKLPATLEFTTPYSGANDWPEKIKTMLDL